MVWVLFGQLSGLDVKKCFCVWSRTGQHLTGSFLMCCAVLCCCFCCCCCRPRYVLAYIESYKGVKAGERVWQLGFGSGFKVNSAVWVARRRNNVSGLWGGHN